ncbi:sugar transporter domain-containing protein [Ditylenchus destructor]|uniref:Sugar transporter domain-containing protein n=1 Tax=Ditylenchus destructor TaxID=166010 RepID=A0AAD4NCL1_9BILA|nr:sugar transporter domain-containing protein [Ditylenchus destructor]
MSPEQKKSGSMLNGAHQNSDRTPLLFPFIDRIRNNGNPEKFMSGKDEWMPGVNIRMYSVVMSIGAGSMFLVSLDSVVDNLLPVAQPYLLSIYRSSTNADCAWEWIVSSRIYGLAVGCMISLLLANCSSRRKPLIWALSLNLIGGLLTALIMYIPSQLGVTVSCIGRFLSGIGSGVAQVVGSAMLAEIPPIHSRGTVLATLTVWACVGELTGMIVSLDSVLGRPSTWHLALVAPNLLIPLALFFIVTAPDSPRSLLISGNTQEALDALKFYQCSEDWMVSLADIRSEAQSLVRQNETGDIDKNFVFNKRNDAALNELYTTKPAGITTHNDSYILRIQRLVRLINWRLRSGAFVRPLLLGMFVLTFAHLDDWLWISYSTRVFQNAGMESGEAMRASLLMSFPQAILSIALLFCFDGFSRRLLLIAPTVISIIIATLAVVGLSKQRAHQDALWGNVSIQKLMVILASIDLSAAAVASESAYTVVPELFSQRDRILGSAIIGIVQNLFGGVLTTVSLSIINIYGTQFVLLPFIAINIVYVLVVYRWLPETNGKSFHTISTQFHEELPQVLTRTSLFINVIGGCLNTRAFVLVVNA